MNLHRLRCAVTLADHGSFTDAAALLGISQPTLSHAIARLEEELGTRLFERTPGGTRPTAAGESMLGPARRALLEADNVRSAIERTSGVLGGRLRVVGIRTAVREFADLIARFRAVHDRVTVVVQEPTGDDGVIRHLRDGVAEVGLMRAAAVPTDLDPIGIGDQQVVIAYPPGTAPASATVSLDALSGRDMIVPLTGTTVRRIVDGIVDRLTAPPRIVAECASDALELVRSGVGVSLESAGNVRADGRDGVEVRPVEGLTTRIAVVTTRWPSPAASAFRAIVADRDA